MSTDRSAWIGGSDIGAIVGVSPWATPLDVYYSKVGWPDGVEPDVDATKQKIFARGRRLEPIIREMAQDEFGLVVTKISTDERPNRYTDEVVPYFAAEIDFEAIVTPRLHETWPQTSDIPIGTCVNCEVKTSHQFAQSKFGEWGSDEVPFTYAAQALWGLGVTGRRHCLFFVLSGMDNLLPYRVDYDEELIASLRKKGREFWESHVLMRVPPPPQTLADLDYLLPRNVSTKVVADAQLSALWREYEDCKRQERLAIERIDDLKFEIGCAMLGGEKMENPTKIGKHELVVDGRSVMSITYCETKRMDQKRVLEAYPEAAGMQSVSRYYKFDPVRSKK